MFAQPASGVMVGGCRVLAGSSSWADRSLVRDGSFYPSRSLSATQRLLHYASRLPLTEVATTYRFPPTPDVAKRWVASTPAGFTMDCGPGPCCPAPPLGPSRYGQTSRATSSPPVGRGPSSTGTICLLKSSRNVGTASITLSGPSLTQAGWVRSSSGSLRGSAPPGAAWRSSPASLAAYLACAWPSS